MKFCLKLGKTAVETHEMFKTVCGNELYLVRMRENGLKNIEMDVRTLKSIDSGWPQLLEIRKQKYANLWPKVVRNGCLESKRHNKAIFVSLHFCSPG
jgi:hypothetical protein